MRCRSLFAKDPKVFKIRVGTLNVGTMMGKGREIADMMQRRKIKALCVQERRWKGNEAKILAEGYKLLYSSASPEPRNGIGVILHRELQEESIDRLEEKMEDWRKALEERGMKISRTKSEYLAMQNVQMRSCEIQDDELKSVCKFKYLGSYIQRDGGLYIRSRCVCRLSGSHGQRPAECLATCDAPVDTRLADPPISGDNLHAAAPPETNTSAVCRLLLSAAAAW
ncbi:uncharacterized protein LOC124593928 [Schistocerca americana]|uniref:uncharacterized protein LOC124593928 n=1 Tax=Schistocerca americana TaxID=7009 RepID=UPI001F4FEE54|nr:uncharacterized protein LOC124593928 [Schistocerca americana]